jgi:hypothetical protein
MVNFPFQMPPASQRRNWRAARVQSGFPEGSEAGHRAAEFQRAEPVKHATSKRGVAALRK